MYGHLNHPITSLNGHNPFSMDEKAERSQRMSLAESKSE